MPDTNTPVQTPSSDSFYNQKDDEARSGLAKGVEPEKPLSPPNPSPSPEKHKLDDQSDSIEKRQKSEEEDVIKEDTVPDTVPQANAQFAEPAPKPPSEPDMDNLPQNPMPKHQSKFALSTIKAIKRLRDASPFLRPVDPVKLNIPFYYNYIQRPMDLSTIERKITVDAYTEPSQVIEDFNLMVNNCIKFNGEQSGISKMAKNVQAHFEKHMLNMPPKVLPSNGVSVPANSRRRAVVADIDKKNSVAARRPKRTIHPPKSRELPYDIRPRKKKYAAELRFCNQTIKELSSKKHYNYNYPFLVPVDPVALNIPNYNEIVKNPMDLGTIQSKLSNNQYENADDFEKDVRLVFQNCYSFNPEGTDVNIMGHKLESIFDKKWTNRPIAQPTPPNSDLDDYSDEDDDDDMEIDEAALSSIPTIQLLENQLARMKRELDDLKKQHLTKMREQRDAKRRRRKAKKLKSRKSSSVDGSSFQQPIVTYEMKKQVSDMVPNLSDKKLQSLIKIIKSDVDLANEEEVELDMDQLEDGTVLKLYNFLFGKKASSSLMNKKKKKNSTGGVDQLEQLRSQLQLFDDVDKPLIGITNDEESSDDDDASSESSEEE